MNPNLLEQIQSFIGGRVVSPQGQFFPQSQLPQPGFNPEALQFAKELAVGATSSPVSAADSRITRNLLSRIGAGEQLSMGEVDKAMKIARKNLNIPQKIFSRMPLENLLNEVAGLSQVPRADIEGIKRIILNTK